MSLVEDLKHLSVEIMDFPIIDELAKRGAFPVMHAGTLIGFNDYDGIPLVRY